MDYEVKEIDGKKYRVFKSGSKLRIIENKCPHLPKHGGVYLLTDASSGMRYVGSSFNVNRRASNYMSINRRELNSRGLFKNLKSKDLTFELLEDCKYLSEADRLKLEREWILKLGTLHPEGLNSVLPQKPKKIKEKPEPRKFRNRAGTNILSKFK